MNDKEKYKWLLLLLAGICCFACTAEREPTDGYAPAGTRSEVPMSVHLGVQGAAVDPEQINTEEAAIRRLRLYVFDGNVLDKMYYWDNINALEAYTTPTFMVKAGTDKSFYLIVNEPQDAATRAQLEAVTHPAYLPEIKYDLTAMGLDGNVLDNVGNHNYDCLPMYGELDGVNAPATSTAASPQQLEISVDRAVARVDVYVKKDSNVPNRNSMISLEQVRNITYLEKGFLSPHSLPEVPEGTESIFNLSNALVEETEKNVLSFYVPEMDCRNRKVKLALAFTSMATTINPSMQGEWTSIVELGDGASPALDKIERNHVYKLHCNLNKVFEIDCTVDQGAVCGWTYKKQVEEVVQDARITNCYIVRPGSYVDIPLRDVYAAWAHMKELGKKPIPAGHPGIKLVWQDAQVISSIGLMDGTAYFRVTTNGMREGNAVVAFVMEPNSANEVVYWSWHIWVTDYNPDNPAGQKNVNGRIWMDRNLGAMANQYTADGAARGLIYQWGRKDPFPSAKEWTTIPKAVYGPNDTTTPNKNFTFSKRDNYDNTNNLPFSINHPDMYVYVTSDNYDWYSSNPSIKNDTLWRADKKTIFDPCPAGWCVPDLSAFNPELDVSSVSKFLSNNYGFDGTMGCLSVGDEMYIPFNPNLIPDGVFINWDESYSLGLWGTSIDTSKLYPSTPPGVIYWIVQCNWSVKFLGSPLSTGSILTSNKNTASSVRCVKEK